MLDCDTDASIAICVTATKGVMLNFWYFKGYDQIDCLRHDTDNNSSQTSRD